MTGDLLKPAQWKFLEEQAIHRLRQRRQHGEDRHPQPVPAPVAEGEHSAFHNPLTTSLGGPYPGQLYDVILANPPFAGKIQKESILADHQPRHARHRTAVPEMVHRPSAPEGRAGVIVPNGVLFGSTKAERKVRELLLTECELQAVINLPSGVFKPYSGVGTAALIFREAANPHPDPSRLTGRAKSSSGSTISPPMGFRSTTNARRLRPTTFPT